MKNLNFSIFLLFIVILGCKKVYLPIGITTEKITRIDSLTVKLSGSIESDGGSEITDRGFCWGFTLFPTIADNKISVSGITSMFDTTFLVGQYDKIYYYRTFATNSRGTIYGNTQSFSLKSPITFNSSLQYETITDNEGNLYKTIKIGNQIWMAENLRTSHYNNGNVINKYYVNSTDSSYQMPCNNDDSLVSTYGRFYSYKVLLDKRGICPNGWHIPTYTEWMTLINNCGGTNGNTILKLSEVGNIHWTNVSVKNSNAFGFTALPNGFFNHLICSGFNTSAAWWIITPVNYNGGIYYQSIQFNNSIDFVGVQTNNAYSIRCIKD